MLRKKITIPYCERRFFTRLGKFGILSETKYSHSSFKGWDTSWLQIWKDAVKRNILNWYKFAEFPFTRRIDKKQRRKPLQSKWPTILSIFAWSSFLIDVALYFKIWNLQILQTKYKTRQFIQNGRRVDIRYISFFLNYINDLFCLFHGGIFKRKGGGVFFWTLALVSFF